MTIYMCSPHFEGILCGVYDAWMSRRGHENVRLEIKGGYQEIELFSEYVEVEETQDKAGKVIIAVCKKLSQQVYRQIYIASLSEAPQRADKIYRFLVQAFHYGPSILDMLQLPEVYEIFRICRSVTNESHLLTEFIRFAQGPGNVLISRIGPKNDVLTLLSPHFADRLPEENWMIYDENRQKASVHPAGGHFLIVEHALDGEDLNGKTGEGSSEEDIWKNCLREGTDEEEYQQLWKAFFHAIAITERKNPLCQRTHLPFRFRPYMTEFQTPYNPDKL